MGLSARVSDRCRGFGPFRLVGAWFAGIKRGDVYACEVGVMTGRVSAQRLAVLRSQLTKRDWELIGMLAAVKLANGTQLSQATSSDNSPAAQRAARRQLARLAEWRVLERLERRQGGLGRGSDAWTYALGPVGLRLSGDGARARHPQLPGQAMWAHALLGA